MNYIDLKRNYRKIGIFVVITIIFSFLCLNFAKEKKDFIYIVPKIKNFEVLRQNIGEYTLENLNQNNEEIKQINILNGSIFYNIPNGEYKVIGKYLKDTDEIFLKKEKEWEKVYLNLEGVTFTQNQEKFLNFLTFSLIIFNIFLYFNAKKKLPPKNILNLIFYLVTIKIFLSLRLNPSNNFYILLDFIITRLSLFLMTFYFLKNIFPKKLEKTKKIVYLILSIIYLYNIFIALIIYSPQFLVFLLDEHLKFLKFISFFRRGIDLTRVLFIMTIITFIYYSSKIKKENILNWIIIWLSFSLLEFFRELFPTAENLGYFIDLMEIFCIYWGLVFYTFKIYNRNVLRAILYSIAITLSYILLFYFKNTSHSLIVLGTVILMDFYANVINKVMYVGDMEIEQIYNRLCLVKNIDEFQELLELEIGRRVKVEKILVKILLNKKEGETYIENPPEDTIILSKEYLKISGFDYAYRIGFNKNKEIAYIFIKEGELSLTIGEQNFLLDLSLKSANIINKLRLETLYKELS